MGSSHVSGFGYPCLLTGESGVLKSWLMTLLASSGCEETRASCSNDIGRTWRVHTLLYTGFPLSRYSVQNGAKLLVVFSPRCIPKLGWFLCPFFGTFFAFNNYEYLSANQNTRRQLLKSCVPKFGVNFRTCCGLIKPSFVASPINYHGLDAVFYCLWR